MCHHRWSWMKFQILPSSTDEAVVMENAQTGTEEMRDGARALETEGPGFS